MKCRNVRLYLAAFTTYAIIRLIQVWTLPIPLNSASENRACKKSRKPLYLGVERGGGEMDHGLEKGSCSNRPRLQPSRLKIGAKTT